MSGVYVDIVTLASSASSKRAFYSLALRCVASALESPYATVYMRSPTEVIDEEHHSGPTDPGFWRSAVQGFLTDAIAAGQPRAKLLSVRESSLKLGMIAVPLVATQEGIDGGLGLVTRMTEQDVSDRVRTVESLVALISKVAESLEMPRSAGSGQVHLPHSALSRSAEFLAPKELAFSLTNSLRNRLGFEQVAIGLVTRNRVELLSISGMDDVRSKGPGVVQMRAAMEECVDFGKLLFCQKSDSWSAVSKSTGHRLHKQWHNATRGAAVASIPLNTGDRCVAVLSLRHVSNSSFTLEDLQQIRDAVEPYASALLLLERAQRGLVRHAYESAWEGFAALVQPRRYGVKLTALLITLFAGWFLFGSLDYEVTVPCALQPAQLRHLTVPYESVLASVAVTAGDPVHAGQILCELDHQELDLEWAELRAEYAVAEQEVQRAMAGDSPVEARLAEANARLFRARLAIVEHRIDQATIRSPVDGVVVDGDLRERVRGVFRQGEPLFQVAPLGDWKLRLEVPEWAISELTVGLPGRFATHARPEKPEAFRVARIRPNAEIRDGRNVFVAEAGVNIDAAWMRPGMEGVAKITVDRRPVWWVTFHHIINYVRLHLWL
ncbi:MAG: HlyD family efflux transporter periplasmic adaptor subunit [Phycisphaerales bacterium]|nr:MAG: HlyD family efflux transporter periplasmic adaptor subunit [Phycisphaerales bacterium]